MGFRLSSFHVSCAVVLVFTTCLGQSVHINAQASSKPRPHQASTPDPGTVTEGVYHNAFFAFSCRIPFGWVERTAQMQEGGEPGKSLVLLSSFERPPEAKGDTVNSAIVIAAESVASYPGLRNAADYFGPLTELTTSKGFKVVNEPSEVSVGSKQLVRGDFSKDMGTLTMYQASLVALEKGYVLSFTFLAGSEDDADALIDGLSFGGGAKATKRRPSASPQ
ncbi:MAG: hypothetical protein LAN63_18015 [Acidobacteriia bacterium]|nr:hypothetical protein [Terriglobia bacterium]